MNDLIHDYLVQIKDMVEDLDKTLSEVEKELPSHRAVEALMHLGEVHRHLNTSRTHITAFN